MMCANTKVSDSFNLNDSEDIEIEQFTIPRGHHHLVHCTMTQIGIELALHAK